jgi:hypothetical protein
MIKKYYVNREGKIIPFQGVLDGKMLTNKAGTSIGLRILHDTKAEAMAVAEEYLESEITAFKTEQEDCLRDWVRFRNGRIKLERIREHNKTVE